MSSAANTSKNLLFGILALQNDFITRDQLVAATAVWIGDKTRSLENILVEQGALGDDERQLLSALVQKHLAKHDNDPEKSLRSLSSLGSSVKDDLAQLNDSLVTQSVAQVSLDRCDEPSVDPFATRALTPREIANHGVRFRVLRPHARGGLGKVSVALDGELNREVAFKELLDEHADNLAKRSRFLTEAEITGGLEHPGIVPVYGLGHYADGRPFYAMRFIQGDSLKEAIEDFHSPRAEKMDPGERALQLRKLLSRFIDVCEAIEYAHSRGVLHRDLKPGNIMLGKYGETLVVDWGLAKSLRHGQPTPDSDERPLQVTERQDSAETRMGNVVGTPAFMSPEQAKGRLDLLGPASDVYSLGATLYCILTGRAPFGDGELEETLAKVRKGDFLRPREINHAIPKALESICLRAMALRPQDRYPSAQALAEDVEHWLADEPVTAHRETLLERGGRWMRRHRSWTLAGAAALVLVAIVSTVSAVWVNSALHRVEEAHHKERLARQQEVQAREREAALRKLAEQARDFDVRLLEEQQRADVLDEAILRELDGQLQQMAAAPVEQALAQAALRRRQLLAAYVQGLYRSLEKSPFTDEDRAHFDRRVQLLSEVFPPEAPDVVPELNARRDARLAQWDPLFDLQAPFTREVVLAAFPHGVAVSAGNDRLGRTLDGAPVAWLSTGIACPPGNIELAAKFDLSWRSAPAVGASLNFSEEHRYDFLVTVPAYHDGVQSADDWSRLPTLGNVLDKVDDRQIVMLIARDGQTLRRAPLPPLEGPLRIVARREGSQLTLLVNDSYRIDAFDPFPLGSDAPGEFAVVWPQSVHLERVVAQRQRAPQQVTPLERGDQFYARGEITEALNAYRQAPDSSEVQYKIGLCLYALGDQEAYERTMRKVADEAPLEDRQWRLLASVRLMKEYADQEDLARYRAQLERVISQYDLKEIARLLPETDRQTLFEDIRRIGQRSRIALSPRGDIERLQLAVELDQAFNEDVHQRRTTRWRLADAYRVAAVVENDPTLYEPAEQILRDLMIDQPGELPIPPRERAALVSDLVWTLLEQGKQDEARQEVEQWLPDDPAAVRPDYLPLLIDRARLAYLEGNQEAALNDLNQFLERVDVKKISHAEFGAACLLRGMIYEDRGEFDAAREEYRKVRYSTWHAGAPSPSDYANAQGVEMIHLADSFEYDAIATSWLGELTSDEAYRRILTLSTGAGMGAKFVERVAKAAVTPELIREVGLGMFQGERGRALGRSRVLRVRSLRGIHVDGATQLLFVGVMRSAFRTEVTTPEEQQYVYSQCLALFHAFDQERVVNDDMITILELWQGKGSFRDWGKLANRLDPELAASMSYLFGRMHLLHGKPMSAEPFLRYGLESPAAHSFVKVWAQRDLNRIESNKPPSG